MRAGRLKGRAGIFRTPANQGRTTGTGRELSVRFESAKAQTRRSMASSTEFDQPFCVCDQVDLGSSRPARSAMSRVSCWKSAKQSSTAA